MSEVLSGKALKRLVSYGEALKGKAIAELFEQIFKTLSTKGKLPYICENKINQIIS